MQPQDVAVTEVLANLSIGYIVLAAFFLTLIRVALSSNKAPFAKWVAELVESLIIAGVLVFLIIRPFFLQAFFIPSESMEPTLMGHKHGYNSGTGQTYQDDVNDHIFVYKLGMRMGNPKPGEIIVFKAPKEADATGNNVENVLIKRLIGVGGDTIQMKTDATGKYHIYRNGQALVEPYINEEMQNIMPTGKSFAVDEPLTLKPDELFMMGDNRNHSNDSRFWGPLKRDRVIGKAEFIFWPLSRIRLVR
ncbi:MAG: signal peptidase I [Chthonomonadales bacterium]